MATDKFPNIFVAVLKQSLALGGSETEAYLSTVRTLDGQTIQASDFAYLGRGVLSVDIQSASRAEFMSFTGVDDVNNGFTGLIRGLSFNSNDIIAANKKFHAVGAPVIIAFGTHNLIDLETIIQANLATIEAQIAALSGVYLELNGGNEPTANINWGGFKIVNLANGVSAQDAITVAQLAAAVIAGGIPATTSQGGYVKVATQSEFLNNTNTTVVGPFTFYNMITVQQANSIGTFPFTYGEDITALNYVFQASGLEIKTISNGNFSQENLPTINNNTQWQGGVITPYATAKTIKSIVLGFGRYSGGTLTGTCVAKIFAISGGLPTGSPLATSNTFNATGFGSASQAQCIFTFGTPFTVAPGTSYALVVDISGLSFSGGVQLELSSSPGSGGYASTDSGATYVAQSATLSYSLNQSLTIGDIYNVDSNTISSIGNFSYKGFAINTAVAGTSNPVQLSNIISGFTSLLVGQPVYINSSVAGGVTQTAGGAGTNRIIGIAVSTTQIQLLQLFILV